MRCRKRGWGHEKAMHLYRKKTGYFFYSVIFFAFPVLLFTLARLAPGDPLVSYYGDRVEKMSPEERDQAEEKLGLKEPISVQYVKWLKRVAHGDFGIFWNIRRTFSKSSRAAWEIRCFLAASVLC